ncbi:MAG: hypothetical protein HY540_04650 [Deltaproteobacteria bacterium]|nr:hypothetical protein [Deltaproteobacteria bacterium]
MTVNAIFALGSFPAHTQIQPQIISPATSIIASSWYGVAPAPSPLLASGIFGNIGRWFGFGKTSGNQIAPSNGKIPQGSDKKNDLLVLDQPLEGPLLQKTLQDLGAKKVKHVRVDATSPMFHHHDARIQFFRLWQALIPYGNALQTLTLQLPGQLGLSYAKHFQGESAAGTLIDLRAATSLEVAEVLQAYLDAVHPYRRMEPNWWENKRSDVRVLLSGQFARAIREASARTITNMKSMTLHRRLLDFDAYRQQHGELSALDHRFLHNTSAALYSMMTSFADLSAHISWAQVHAPAFGSPLEMDEALQQLQLVPSIWMTPYTAIGFILNGTSFTEAFIRQLDPSYAAIPRSVEVSLSGFDTPLPKGDWEDVELIFTEDQLHRSFSGVDVSLSGLDKPI